MTGMTRCTYCRHFIFPWQRRGYIVRVMRWHVACRRQELGS